eukprot:5141551-Prymnesium_polylepis.1
MPSDRSAGGRIGDSVGDDRASGGLYSHECCPERERDARSGSYCTEREKLDEMATCCFERELEHCDAARYETATCGADAGRTMRAAPTDE